jgi:hypothetical protein
MQFNVSFREGNFSLYPRKAYNQNMCCRADVNASQVNKWTECGSLLGTGVLPGQQLLPVK